MKILAAAAAAIIFVGCTAAPAPTPQVIVKTVEVPGPQPTPQVITKTIEVPGPQPTPQVITKTVTVEVTPKSCIYALDGLVDTIIAQLDIIIDYSDGGVPTKAHMKAYSQASEDTDANIEYMDECRAANASGTN